MSLMTASMAPDWSGVSSKGNVEVKGVQVEELGGGVAHLARGLALGLLPLPAAQPVQRRALGRGTGIAADDMQLRNRHVELVAAFVFEVQEFHLAFAQVERDEAEVAADAVLAVHHRVAGLHLGQVAHHAFGAGARSRVAPARLPHLSRIKLGLGDDGDPFRGQHESGGERPVGERQRMLGGDEAPPIVDERGMHAVLGEERRDRLAPAGALRDDERAAGEGGDEARERLQWLDGAPVDFDRGRVIPAKAGIQ